VAAPLLVALAFMDLRCGTWMEICEQQSEIEVRHLPAISIYGYVGGRKI